MNLRDGVIGVRSRLGEGNKWLFNNVDIIRDLNFSARALVSSAQAIRSTFASITALNPAAGAGVFFQEYAMPVDCEFPISGKVKIGVLYPLTFMPQDQLQMGGFVASIPLTAYLRFGVIQTQQVSPGGEIVQPPPGRTGQPSWWIGFWPIPSGVNQFFIDYVAYHPQMVAPMDMCLIPEAAGDDINFFDAWVAYATARGKEKEGDMESAVYYDALHNKGKVAYRNYMGRIQTTTVPPKYGGSMGNPLYDHGPGVLIMAPTAANLSIE